ncbi:RecQ family ATP-dependent DNA helicase [Halobacillus sp. K22]|uniref:RecQ family ATP-dependent DNA helicase n=1 Tax=Halobacillus sp. K22 TaxID=3457431 RepID=UPI003FCE39B2
MQMYDLSFQLEKHFGFSQFREGQKPIIESILSGNDVLGILPTGTGKSLCYQLPAKIQSGTAIVVSPLISLMIDQVKQLKASGYKSVVALNSFMDRAERRKTLEQLNQYDLIYMSPELLQNNWVKQHLVKLNVSLFVIDEAHCISQWGHEFRTDYLKLHQTISDLGEPPVLALSATATPEVQTDIMDKLKRPQMEKHIYPMDKQNVSFAVEHYAAPDQKIDRLIQLLSDQAVPTMIYFSSRQWAEKAAYTLQTKLKQRVAFYHGGMDQMDRMLVQQQFMNDQLDVICCTSAFGMGVDKSNIRLVIHFHPPSQLESFIQEVGRAGRDGKPCASLVLYGPKDHYLPQMLIESELPQMDLVQSVLSHLNTLWKENTVIPPDDKLTERLELSESQWNFLRFQLEEYKVLEERTILKDPKETVIEHSLETLINTRWNYKQGKLTEMLQWVHQTACRRKSLYESFQKDIREPIVPCCDACGFTMDTLNFEKTEVHETIDSWKERLAIIFGQGARYETKKTGRGY